MHRQMKDLYSDEISADIHNLSCILDSLEKALSEARVHKEDRHAIILATEEAVTNIVHHAYADREKGPVRISCKIDKNQCIITLIDKGKRFNPADVPLPDISADIASREIGGLGIYLIRHFMDSVSYSFSDDIGNQLVMVKKIKKQKLPSSDPEKPG